MGVVKSSTTLLRKKSTPATRGFLMEKRQFFDNLASELSIKYSISPNIIHSIRSFALGNKFIKEEIMDWADLKIQRGKKSKSHDVGKKYIETFNFLENLSDEDFADITQKTEFDK